MPPTNSAAPGSAAGYLFQLERALVWLARSGANDQVGIETTEDVVRKAADDTLVLEQDKHSLNSDRTPFADWSLNLWKTLANWCDAIVGGLAGSTFQLHLVTNQVVPEGIARRLARASELQDIEAGVREIRSAKSGSEATQAQIQRVCSHSDETLRLLIANVQLFDATDHTSGQDMLRLVVDQLHLPEHVEADVIINSLLGWIQYICMTAWRAQHQAWITGQAFNNYLHRLIAVNRTHGLIRAVSKIPVSEDARTVLRDRMFVRQIRLLELEDETDEIRAMNDYVRAEIERTRLVSRGDITLDDWEHFEIELTDRWERLYGRYRRSLDPNSPKYSDEARRIGQSIFDETLGQCSVCLCGVNPDQYLICGQYHLLADDGETVGWHPNFRELLKDREDD